VFFLAGHETTASVLTWLFFICAERPSLVTRMREEIDRWSAAKRWLRTPAAAAADPRGVPGDPAPVSADHLHATGGDGGHHHRAAAPAARRPGDDLALDPASAPGLLEDPHASARNAFCRKTKAELTDGAYIPFGQGPHTCVGAGFAQTESLLIITELLRRFDFTAVDPKRVCARRRG
jgi:cytochrome P450